MHAYTYAHTEVHTFFSSWVDRASRWCGERAFGRSLYKQSKSTSSTRVLQQQQQQQLLPLRLLLGTWNPPMMSCSSRVMLIWESHVPNSHPTTPCSPIRILSDGNSLKLNMKRHLMRPTGVDLGRMFWSCYVVVIFVVLCRSVDLFLLADCTCI